MSSPRYTIAAFGGIFALVIIARFVVDLRDRYDAAIDGAKQSAENYAEVLAEHTARTFEAVDRSLREAELIRQNLVVRSQGNAAAEGGNAEAANEALRHLQQTSPLLLSIGWTNAAGDLIAHSNAMPVPKYNLATLPHFIAQRDAADDKMFIASPFYSPGKGEWLIAASRRVTNPDGSFAGIAAAILDQTYFSGIYRSLHLGPNGSVLLTTHTGAFLVREPRAEAKFGQSFADGPLLTTYLPRSEAGSFELTSHIDGVERIAGYKAVPGVPLIVVVTLSRADVLAAWYRHLLVYTPLAAIVVVIVLFGTLRLARQTRDVARKSNILDLTLENMAHGLCMFDREQRLTICNRRYGEIYGLTEEQTKPGVTFRSILEGWVPASENEAAQTGIENRIEKATRQEPYYAVNKLPNGRVIGVTHQPIEAGGWVAIHQDITDRRRYEEKVAYMAHHDLLTGVANRTYFVEQLEAAAARLRQRDEPFGVFMLDLDKFKSVNDLLGHPAGDALLRQVAHRLKAVLREADVLARLGGDEFAIILPGQTGQRAGATPLANQIIDVITEPYDINGNIVSIGTSIGIALAPTDGIDPETLMKKADLALYRTKSEGRNDFCFFDAGMAADANARRQLEIDLRNALINNEFEVHYQPIIDVATEQMFAVEALLRWHRPDKGYIPPAQFIPLAEETGLMASLGEWVLQTACNDAMRWPSHIKIAVNISPLQLRKSNLLDIIFCALSETGLSPERLELEIAETALFETESSQWTVLRQLKNLGVSISLDDFGVGYSSLSHLTTFPFDRIKIDKLFTQNLTHRADYAIIVSSVLALGAGLELPTVAEGVETQQQFEILRASGVKYVQGYLFGRPCLVSELDFDRKFSVERLENVA